MFEIKEGVSRFSVEVVLSYSTENFRNGTLPGFRKFLVSKNPMDKRGEEGLEYHALRFSFGTFLSHGNEKVPKEISSF